MIEYTEEEPSGEQTAEPAQEQPARRIKTKTVTDPVSGKYLCIHYNADGLAAEVTDNSGRCAAFTYEEGRLAGYRNVLGEETTFGYDAYGRITTETDCAGVTYVTNTYDENGRVTSQWDADDTKPATTFRYQEQGTTKGSILTTTMTTPEGAVLTAVSDEGGNLVKTIDGEGNITETGYDEEGNELFERAANGSTVLTEYDDRGRKSRVTDQSGNTLSFDYDDRDNLIRITGADGSADCYEYNERNLLVKAVTGTGRITEYEYNEDAQPVKVTEYGSLSDGQKSAGQEENQEENGGEGLSAVTTYAYTDGLMSAVTDAEGNTTRMAYDSAGRMTVQTDALGGTTRHEYDAAGRTVRITDALGGETTYTYDRYGNVLTQTDPLGNTVAYEYGVTGLRTREILPDGSVTAYEYDRMGRLTGVTQPDGTRLSYTYDRNGNLLSETNELNETITYEYNAVAQCIKETGAAGTTIRYAYYPNGKPYATEYPDGRSELYTYDECWNLIGITDAQGYTTGFAYDAAGNRIRESDPLGNSVTYAYDVFGRLIKETDANGNSTAYDYDRCGNCIRKTMADGTVATFAYDALHRLIKTECLRKGNGGEAVTETCGYDALSRLTNRTDSEGGTTTYEYDACGNLLKETDPLGSTTVYEYDTVYRPAAVTDALGQTTTYTYNIRGMLTETGIQKAGTQTTAGIQTTADIQTTTGAQTTAGGEAGSNAFTGGADNTPQAGNTQTAGVQTGSIITTYGYDSTGRPVRTTDAAGGTVMCTYDSDGRMTTVTDAMGGVTSYAYDAAGRVTKETGATGNENSYAYNTVGLLQSFTDAKGQTASYTYDAAGRLKEQQDEEGTVRYSYDGNGNVTEVKETKKEGEKEETITRTYDCRNRVTSCTDSNGRTVRYGYDELGNLLTLTYPGGEIIRYSYDGNGRIRTVTDGAGRVTYYTYDVAGNLIQTDRPDGTRETDTYDALGQLTERKDIRLSDGAVINEYHYTYDERGNILSVTGTGTAGITVSAQGEVSAGGGTDSSTDSNADSSTDGSNGSNTGKESGTQTAQEGTTSELSQAEQALLVLQDTSMTYDADNRLIRYNGEDVRYDADGNMVYGPVDGVMTALVYDCRNRLVKAGEVRYEYDAENVRTAVITQEAGTEYVTDRVSALPQVLETYVTAEESDSETKTKEPANDSKTDSAKESEEEQTGNDLEPAAVFVYGNGLLYSYEVSAAEKQGETAADGEEQDNPQSTVQTAYTETKGSLLVYHYNNIGSTTALTDQTGTVVERYVYGAYGEISGGDTARTAYLYNGMYGVQTDADGLYYMRARYYNVDIKRFINRDVVKGNLQNSQSLNRYSYVQGNPVSLIDPFGLSPFKFKISVHSVLSFIGAIPGIGDLADAANAFLYLKEKDYKNAARSGLCALPFMGELAGVTILAKAPKAARCVRNATRIIGYGATFNWAAEGATDSAVNICHNIASGNFFSADTAKNLVMGGMNAAAMIFSGKQVADSTKDLAKMAKQDAPKILSKVKEEFIRFHNDNRGSVDLDALGICKSKGGQSAYQGGSEVVDVKLSRKKYPESAQHIEEAIKEGQPDILTIDRGGASSRRKASLQGVDTVSGLDRDEYPPAMSKEGGAGASVKLINPSDNRGSGSFISGKLRKHPNGTKYRIIITDED